MFTSQQQVDSTFRCTLCMFLWTCTKAGKWYHLHSSTLAWKIPWTEEPGGLQSMGLLRVGHDWVTSLSLFPFMHWRRKWQPTPVFLPGESQGWGSLVGCCLWGRSHRVGHNWSDLAAAAAEGKTGPWELRKHLFCCLILDGSLNLSEPPEHRGATADNS